MILVITSKRDGHVEAVTRHFSGAGVRWIRINIEDFATNVEIEVTPQNGDGRVLIRDSGLEFLLRDVEAVWFRKPDPVVLRHFDLDPGALEYVEAELNEVVFGLYALLGNAFWINDPFKTRIAHRKLLQLKTAVDVGFTVPRTVLTNDPSAALKFAAGAQGDTAVKSLGAISVMQEGSEGTLQYGIFTRRVSATELATCRDKISHMPTLFQTFIEKEAELRITCVGGRCFPCRIEPRDGDVTSDDYRFDTVNLRHTAVEQPHLESRMRDYLKRLDLRFGCFDFIVAKTGEIVFLECNPNGQWLWIEDRTGQRIGEAIAEELLSHCSNS